MHCTEAASHVVMLECGRIDTVVPYLGNTCPPRSGVILPDTYPQGWKVA